MYRFLIVEGLVPRAALGFRMWSWSSAVVARGKTGTVAEKILFCRIKMYENVAYACIIITRKGGLCGMGLRGENVAFASGDE